MEKKKTTSKKATKPVVKKTTTQKKVTKKRKIAFTLIELLAVIVILGILMLVAIPSVTTYINNSRKESYIDTVQNIIKGATNLVNSGELNMFDPDTTYYIPSKCIKLETGGNSPYGEFDPAYIAVTYDNNSFNYYWISRDISGIGIKEATPVDELTSRALEANIKKEDIKMTSLEGKSKILVIDENDCRTMNEVEEERKIEYISRKEAGKISFKDEVAIDTEHFTVLSSEDEKTILVAKSNL